MRKLKLLMAACALLGASAGWAQEDVTSQYLQNADLSTVNSGWTYFSDAFKYTDWKTDGDVPVVEFYSQWNAGAAIEIAQKDFKFSQTISIPAGDYRLAVNAFYRNGGGDGTNEDKAWIFVKGTDIDKKQNVVGLTSAGVAAYSGSNDLYKAANAFSKGDFSNAFDFTIESETEVEIGFQGFFNLSLSWCILGPVKLYKYSLDDYLGDYRTKVSEAEALYETPMNADVLSALKAAVVAESSFSLVADVTEAIQALTTAIVNANNSVANYNEAKAVLDAANNLDASGQASYSGDETIQAIQEAYDDRTLDKLTNEQKTAATAAYNTAVKAQTEFAEGSDMSAWIVNPDFAAGNYNGWTRETPMGGNCQIQGGTRMEYWAGNASNRAQASFNIYQVIDGLPNGVYTVTAFMYNSLNGEGGDYTEFSPTCGVYGVGINEEVGLVTNEGDVLNPYTTGNIFVYGGKLTIGVKNTVTPMAARWFLVDKFELTYVRALTSDDINNLVGPAREAWTAAQTSANEAYSAHEAAQSFPEGKALNDEIGKSEPSDIDGYTAATTALNEATTAFLAAAPSYEAYAAYKAETEALFGSDLGVSAPSTAAEAATAIQNLNIAQYNKVANDYPYSLSGLIGDFGSWEGTATVNGAEAVPNHLDSEHWSGTKHAYYEQAGNGWGSNSWTIQYQKTCTLPAGSYVIKVAARASGDVVGEIRTTATSQTVALPHVGAESKGINKAGEASWTEGEFARDGIGFGWQWRFLPFELTEKTEVTMTFYAETSKQHNWMSITDGELLSAEDVSEDVAYDESTENTIEDVDVANVTITRAIKEGYNTIVLPFDATANQVAATFGEGTEVYAFSENSEDAAEVTVNFNKGDGSITANTPVLVKAPSAISTLQFTGVQIKAAEAKVAGKNFDFVGTFAPISAIAEGDYFIGNGAVYRSEGSTSLNAFRAYIQAKSAGARIVKFFIDGVETTGIEGVVTAKTSNSKIYNLAGQEVKNAQKGLYIVNGKKVVIK